MNYPGGKNQPGVFHRIINATPPHSCWIEPFAGSAAIFFHKRPAATSILVERDPAVAKALRARLRTLGRIERHKVTVVESDALKFLRTRQWKAGDFVYCDPPYLLETRASSRPLYRFEFEEKSNGDRKEGSRAKHIELLDILTALPCPVLLSGYGSSLYFDRLKGWRETHYRVGLRGGRSCLEFLWANFPEPTELHDYSLIGETWRQRQDFRRMRRRWIERLTSMPAHRRFALLSAIEETLRTPAATAKPPRRSRIKE